MGPGYAPRVGSPAPLFKAAEPALRMAITPTDAAAMPPAAERDPAVTRRSMDEYDRAIERVWDLSQELLQRCAALQWDRPRCSVSRSSRTWGTVFATASWPREGIIALVT